MGYWFIFFALDAGVPVQVQLYTYEEQRCLQVADEHLKSAQKNGYVDVLYSNCLPGSKPRT